MNSNPLENPPREIAQQGLKAIREYFHQLREEGVMLDALNLIDDVIIDHNSPKSKNVKIFGLLAALAPILALFFPGIFTTEVRQWFEHLFERDFPSTSQPEQN